MKTFGDYVEKDAGQEYLVIHFSPTLVPLQQRWRNNGLSADFLAEYWVTFFPSHDIPSQHRQLEIKDAINYIANELLENVMKFSCKQADHPVSLGLYLYRDKFRFYASNTVGPQAVEEFQAHIQELLTKDPRVLHLRQIERNVADGDIEKSRLGLLTIINDYDARLAWKFESHPRDSEIATVTTMVQLDI